MAMDRDPIGEALEQQDWGDVYARLFDFALKRCGAHAKAQAKDLAQEAIARVWARNVPWDPVKEPDLVRRLMHVVDSLRANERSSYAARNTRTMHDKAGKAAVASVADPQAWSEGRAVEENLLARRLELLRERMVDDPKVLALLDLLEREVDAPDEIRKETRWSANELLAVRRRMLRAAAQVARDVGGAMDGEEPLDAGAAHERDEDESDDDEEVA
jgi:hypothetical protein